MAKVGILKIQTLGSPSQPQTDRRKKCQLDCCELNGLPEWPFEEMLMATFIARNTISLGSGSSLINNRRGPRYYYYYDDIFIFNWRGVTICFINPQLYSRWPERSSNVASDSHRRIIKKENKKQLLASYISLLTPTTLALYRLFGWLSITESVESLLFPPLPLTVPVKLILCRFH